MQRLKGECSYNPDIDLDCVDVESEERDDELSDYVVEEPDWIPTPVCLPSDDGSDEEESVEEEEDVEDVKVRRTKLLCSQQVKTSCTGQSCLPWLIGSLPL